MIGKEFITTYHLFNKNSEFDTKDLFGTNNLFEIYPYWVSSGFLEDDNNWIFLTPQGKIKVRDKKRIFKEILDLCDGENSIKDICLKLRNKFAFNEVVLQIADFFQNDILVDKHNIFSVWKKYGENPMLFGKNLNNEYAQNKIKRKLIPKDIIIKQIKIPLDEKSFNLEKILNKRCSTRKFVKKSIEEDDIVNLFWSAFGKQKNRQLTENKNAYTIPSGGALYPIVLYLVIFQETKNFVKGIYRWNKEKNEFGLIREIKNIQNIIQCIDGLEKKNLKNATGIMIISASFSQSQKKYSNKAYQLVLLEAGHIIENAYLYSAEKNIGFVEVLGFDHQKLKEKLNLKLDIVVLGVFGKK